MTRNSETSISLPDVQSSRDERKIAIKKVGVTAVSYPIQFTSASSTTPQPTIACFDMFVSLPAEAKGTHMSRFLQLLGEWKSPFDVETLHDFCQSIRERLQSDDAFVKVRFPFFVDRSAPISGEIGKIQLEISIEVTNAANEKDLVLTVAGPATSLCPCSKEISDRGAHNQRCELKVSVRSEPNAKLGIEDVFAIMERSASTQIFPILKRPDEKWVTEDAYDNPKFVEDIVRDLAMDLDNDNRVTWYRCSSENFESIHQHNAFAEIESDS